MQKISTYLGVALLLLMTVMRAYAVPVMSLTENHYPIRGETADELLAQMQAHGPAANGGKFEASTAYYVKWDVTYQESFNRCELSHARVTLFSTYTLPEWQNYSNASLYMKEKWNQFFMKLKQHEQGHNQHGIEAANEVENMLNSLPVMSSCAQMDETVKAKTNAIITKYKMADAAYDQRTNHGANQVYA